MAPAQDNLPPEFATKDDTPVVVVTVVMTLVATVFIALRLYGCVYILRRRLYLEEWLSVINQIDLWLTAAFVLNLYATTAAGRHWAELSDTERTKAVFWNNVLTGPLLLGLGLPKLTVVSLLTRVFKPGQLHQAILWSAAILCAANFVVAILLTWLSCTPTPTATDVSFTATKWVDSWVYVKFCYYAATFSSAVDLYLALYPGFVFRKLGWDIRKKVVLSTVMGLGIWCVLIHSAQCSVGQSLTSRSITNHGLTLHGSATAAATYKITTLKVLTFNNDFTYYISKTIIPTVVEANTIMIAASISTLHPVYDLIRRKLTGRMANDEGGAAQRRHHNANDTPQGAKLGFWSLLMGRCIWTESNTIASRPNRSRSYSRRGPVSSSTRGNGEMTEVPIRTLEDARDNRGADQRTRREGRTDKALVRLYHAGLASDPGH